MKDLDVNLEVIFDFELFAPTFLKIKTEFGEIVPFEFNSAQKKVVEIVKEKLGVEKLDVFSIMPKRVVLRFMFLKARQQGISTLWQAFTFWWNYVVENQKVLTMGHKKDASNNLFDMYKRFHNKLPLPLQNQIEKSNEKKVSYEIKGSENKIDTAGAGEIGRSDNLQGLHLTEAAFYPDAKTTYTALLQGAKYAKFIIIESTANGFNEFYNDWSESEKGENEFEPVFLSWLDFPEYIEEAKEMGFIKDFEGIEEKKFLEDLGNEKFNEYPDEEKILLEDYNATIDQLKWRRYMITNKCKGSVEKFHQEYPRDPQEAFIASGKPVFPMSTCHTKYAEAEPPLKRGDLVWKERGKTVEFIESSKGWISIWTELDADEYDIYRYAGGGDIAEGLAQGDYSDLRYLDRKTMEVALTWHGHIDPDLLADEELKIQIFLGGQTWMNNEKNNHGVLTINSAWTLGVNQMYASDFDKGYEVGKDELGTMTTGGYKGERSKTMMIDDLVMCIREDLYTEHDKEFWSEAMTFVKDEKGRMAAEGKHKDPNTKCFDDRIISAGKMWMCHKWMPSYRRLKMEQVIKPRMGYESDSEIDEASF